MIVFELSTRIRRLLLLVALLCCCACPVCRATEKKIALLADPLQMENLLEWIVANGAALRGQSFVSTRLLQERLKFDFRTYMLQLDVEGLSDDAADIVIAGKAAAAEIAGVVYFPDAAAAAASSHAVLTIVRACVSSQIPVAFNKETANLVLRGIAKTRNAYLIFNPVAGQGDAEAELALIRSTLEPQMILHVVLTQKDREASDQAREIVNMIKASPEFDEKETESSNNIIVASGGDGTVSAVAGATMGTGIPLGVIPRGTANAFSVALDIPTDVLEACHNILVGNTRRIDAVTCNKVPMILIAGLGFEAGMVDNASRELKNVLGPVAYVLGGAQQVMQQEPFKCRIQIDDKKEQAVETTALTVATVAPPTSVMAQCYGTVIPDDGLLDVTISTATSAWKGLQALGSLVASAIVKEPTKSDALLCVRAKSLTIDCDPPQKAVIDGEILEMNPIHFQVVPHSLVVIAPAEEEQSEEECTGDSCT